MPNVTGVYISGKDTVVHLSDGGVLRNIVSVEATTPPDGEFSELTIRVLVNPCAIEVKE